MSRIKFLNTYIDNLTVEEALQEISRIIDERQGGYVVTPNVDHLITLEKDEMFQKIYKDAALILTDGKPLIWISRFLKTPIKEKISGSDLFPLLAGMAAAKGYTMFFLGAAEGVAAKAAENLCRKNPDLQVVGTYSPSYGFENNQKELDHIINTIHEVKPDILVVGLGTPKQEKFIYQYRDVLEVPISLGLGASLDFEAGNLKRSPRWMSEHGLEWLYRMCREPRRLAKRYFKDAIELVPLVWKYRENKKD